MPQKLRTVGTLGAVVVTLSAVALFVVPGSGAGALGSGPTITSFSPTAAAVGAVVTITGANFEDATSVTFNFNDAPITTDSDGQITTTVPLGDDNGPVAVTTPDGTAQSSATFTLTGLDIATTSLPTAQPGVEYHVQLEAVGGTRPYHWTKTGHLPKGLAMNGQGLISGVPSLQKPVAGTYPLALKVRDSTKHGRQTATGTLSLTVS
ncbi:MAG: IPT/TIG domain-containing protein [Acidimicrobiales bacterium]